MNYLARKCGKCKALIPYPLFKVPLGPVQLEDVDDRAAKAGLEIKDGYILYSWFCLPCTTAYINSITEEDLK